MGILKSIHQKHSGIFPYSFIQQEIGKACGRLPIVAPYKKTDQLIPKANLTDYLPLKSS